MIEFFASSTFHHTFWLVMNGLIFAVVFGALVLLVLGSRRTYTLKTGAGPWVFIGLLLFLPTVVNEILDEADILFQLNLYSDSVYDFIFDFSPLLLFLGALFLIGGLFRQFLVGEQLGSEMVQANQALIAQKQELSDFAHNLAHDLRSEIAYIRGALYLISEQVSGEDSVTVQSVLTHLEQTTSLLNRSLELADAGLVVSKTDQVNLDVLVDEVAQVVLPGNISFSHDVLPTVLGDRTKLYQVFKNLFENAIVHGAPTTIAVTVRVADDATTLFVTNDGPQISPEDRKYIFQSGFTTKDDKSGIGLTIVSRIIAAHGWRIWLEDVGQTTFAIRIPSS
jgi:signal transduction histidine kinase